jgi:16S rRNA (adenine(1408)-N(1))-methyltransferase
MEEKNGRLDVERLCGKRSIELDRADLRARSAGYTEILLDIGTGDGRFVRHVARTRPACFVVGIDACRENLRTVSRIAPTNAVLLIANALALPRDLDGVATRVTINFPWGSLLTGLLDGQPALLAGLRAVTRPGGELEVRLNGGALAEVGWSPAAGADRVAAALRRGGFAVGARGSLDAAALRAFPTSWAKRLAQGRDPQAIVLWAVVRDAGP